MRQHLSIILSIISLAVAGSVVAQRQLPVAYLDLGELRDTIRSPFNFDEDYTPKGRNRWTQSRYYAEVERVTALIDSMAAPVVALCGVETEEVVRDIVRASSEDYCYVHRELDLNDGLDFALLYYGDQFFVDRVECDNTWLRVSGEIFGATMQITLARMASRISSLAPPEGVEVADVTLLMGSVSGDDILRLGLLDILEPTERRGGGDTLTKRGWRLNSRIGLLTELRCSQAGVYVTEWLIRPELYRPHLPSYVVLEIE